MTFEELCAKAEIEELILRHARHVDLGETDETRKLFTEDSVFVTPAGEVVPRREGNPEEQRRNALIFANLYPRIVTNISVTLDGPDAAEAWAYVTLPRPVAPQGEWRYKLRRTDLGWRIYHHQAVLIERDPSDRERLRQLRVEREAELRAEGKL